MHRLLLVAALLAAAPAVAQRKPAPAPPAAAKADPEQLLALAEKSYEALEYEAALKALVAVHQAPGVTAMQRARSFLYMGVCFTALGNAESAVQSFVELLKLKPSFRLPGGVSPSIQAMFKEALLRLKMPETPPPESQPAAGGGAASKPAAGAVSVSASAPGRAVAGRAVEVKIELEDPNGQVEDLIVQWRLVGGPDYQPIRVKFKPGQTRVVGRIPGALLGSRAARLHYLVEALGKGGLALAHAGTINSPLEVELEPAPKPRRRWGWYVLAVGGGLAVAGGVVAAVLATRGSPPAPKPADVAGVTITIR